MDYLRESLAFKARKAARYTRLYGPRRTWVKIESHYHMNRWYDRLPPIRDLRARGRHVGILGCGKFAYAQVAYYLQKNFGDVIYATMDIDIHRAASLFEAYNAAYYTADASAVLRDPLIDTVFIASNHASHAEYAIEAVNLGKTVHIEKPHVVTEDQLQRLCSAIDRSSSRVALGFNRPVSEIGLAIKNRLAYQSGPAVLDWFVVGHEIPPNHWYCNPAEGGRILGNLCHWTDFVYQLIPAENRLPIQINPTRTEQADTDDTNVTVVYTFGDGSIAAITFVSPKGHSFEGVRERFAAHCGNVVITMDDFKTLEVQQGQRKYRIRKRFRDHGHERMICSSYRLGFGRGEGCTSSYVWETGQLFLKTKKALDEGQSLTVEAFGRIDA